MAIFIGKSFTMEVVHLEFVKGAEEARGLAVIIDVFRAFSTACYLYGQGADAVYAARTPEDAFLFREKHPDAFLAGERREKKIEGFDFGNSPLEIVAHDLTGRTAVLTTSAGTLGLTSAVNASLRITGSFVNAGAIARYIKAQQPDVVSLVAMGYNARIPADEDRLCARYIESILNNNMLNMSDIEPVIRSGTGSRFFDPENTHSPREDYFLCLRENRFDFVLEAVREDQWLLLKKKYI